MKENRIEGKSNVCSTLGMGSTAVVERLNLQIGPSGKPIQQQPPRENPSPRGDFQLPKILEETPLRNRASRRHEEPIG